jgi:hypothetical protein
VPKKNVKRRRLQRLPREKGKELALAGIVILACLLMGEVVMRIARPSIRGRHQHPSSVGRDDVLANNRLGRHHPVLGWTLQPNRTITNHSWEFKHTVTTNSKGLRDNETPYARNPSVGRILLLGDSFAMGDGVELSLGFADVLEHLLPNTEVVNMSVSGYGTDQELLSYLIEGEKYDADVVLLALTIANDLENNVSEQQYGALKPYYRWVDGKLTVQGTPIPEKPRRVNNPESMTRSPFPVHDFLDANSAIYASAFSVLARIPILKKRWEEQHLLYRQESVYYRWQLAVLRTKPPDDVEAAWQLTIELLRMWQSATITRGSTPVLVLIPSHLQVYPSIWKQAVDEFDLDPSRFDLDYPNRRLIEVCRAIDLTVIDLLPDFRAAGRAGSTLYYRRNPHWRDTGHRLAAEVIARDLLKSGVYEIP